MDDPFFRSFRSPGRPRRRSPSPPPKLKTSTRTRPPSRTTKVVPVHFVGSDEEEPKQRPVATMTGAAAEGAKSAAAAATIQSVLRGFLVRKNMNALRRLEAEVDAVERGVEASREMLHRDERERLRVNETRMSVLFRLDSVRGVRDYRRRVIRRVIALQEAVDAIAAAETLGSPDLVEETLENPDQYTSPNNQI